MAGDFLARIKQSPVLCDGAMGTLLYANGVFINRCYDELNLSQPDLIRAIHHDYLQAGAEIIETNTFGANSFRLARHSLAAVSYTHLDVYKRQAPTRKPAQAGFLRQSSQTP